MNNKTKSMTSMSDENGIVSYDPEINLSHLLIAGTAGYGKSNFLDFNISSMISVKTPKEIRFLMIDTEIVDFSVYSVLKGTYLVAVPGVEKAIVTDVNDSRRAIYAAQAEMDNRFRRLLDSGTGNLKEYNCKNPDNKIPELLIVINEFAGLVNSFGKEIEKPLIAILEKGRAVGMHIILATNRPTAVSGFMICNFEMRIAFKTNNAADSKHILGTEGAEKLLCAGDYIMVDGCETIHGHFPLLYKNRDDLLAYCQSIADKSEKTEYFLPDPYYYLPKPRRNKRDPLFNKAALYFISTGVATVGALQRKYGIGFHHATKIMDQLEEYGIVGNQKPGQSRDIKMSAIQFIEHFKIKV